MGFALAIHDSEFERILDAEFSTRAFALSVPSGFRCDSAATGTTDSSARSGSRS